MADSVAAISGLSTADFAVCQAMGIRPVGLAQGYYCAHLVDWEKLKATAVYGYGPHPRPSDNAMWVGLHHDLDSQWVKAFDVASDRLRDDARKMGAHGVIGCHVDIAEAGFESRIEAHIYGTAVVVEGAEPLADGRIWSTSLAGDRLANLVACGYVPADIWYAHATVTLGGTTIWYDRGEGRAGEQIEPIRDALALARRSVINGIRDSKTQTAVYGLRQTVEEDKSEHHHHFVCTSHGDRVREVSSSNATYPASTLSLA